MHQANKVASQYFQRRVKRHECFFPIRLLVQSNITRTWAFALVEQQMRLEEAVVNLLESVRGIVTALVEQLLHCACGSCDPTRALCSTDRPYA